MLTPSLKSNIEKLWDKFWSGGIANPLTAIEQITYLIFMKRLDEMDTKRIKDTDWTGEKYSSIFEGLFLPPGMEDKKENKIDKKTLRWSFFKHLKGEEMLSHVQTKVFPFLKELNGKTSPFTQHMQNAVFIIPKAGLLVEAVKIIDEIYKELEEGLQGKQTFQDTQGDIYEYLLSEIASAGKNGQFRTPRHIIQLICELVNPKLGQRIADPACGTAGFLLGAYQHILTQFTSPENIIIDDNGFKRGTIADKLVDEKQRTALDEETLYGFDFDTTMVRIGLMNLMLHGVTQPKIEYTDTLSKSYDEEGIYDIILANPPFTGSLDKQDINENLKLPTTKTELLFIERIFRMLKMGGTAGIIIPQGVLFSSGNAFIQARKLMIEKAELKAVISMPNGIFKPYAGVSTAILIFTKGGETENIWFYDMESDGYKLDDKRTKLKDNGDLQDIVEKFKLRNPNELNDTTQKYFFVKKKEVIENKYDLSIGRYKVEVFNEINYGSPKVILDKINELENEILLDINQLKELI